MYLAAILGICFLTTPSMATLALSAQLLQVTQAQIDATQSGSAQGAPRENPTATQGAPQPGKEPASAKPGTKKAVFKKSASRNAGSELKSSPQTSTTETSQQPHKGQAEAVAKKPTSAPTKPHHHRKHAKATASGAAPEKKVVRNGGTTDPKVQLAPGVSAEQASRERQSTTQLLATTDTNLKQISERQLNSSQQESVSQIRKYMEQAKAAEAEGDVQRAQNLASKARLLSDDLVKH